MRCRSFFFLFAATLPDWGRALVKPGVLEDFSRQYGSQAVRRLNAWRALMDEISGLPLPSRLTRTNAFFNQLAFAEDGEQFGSRDYWATPLEFLGRGRGDCEEFAIAKYVTLVKGRVPLEQLRITYVKALELIQSRLDRPGNPIMRLGLWTLLLSVVAFGYWAYETELPHVVRSEIIIEHCWRSAANPTSRWRNFG